MSPKHGPRRARVVFTDTAQKQLRQLDTPEMIAADRAVVAISTDPQIGDLKPGTPLRQYAQEGTGVRVLYTATVLGTIVIIAYIEA